MVFLIVDFDSLDPFNRCVFENEGKYGQKKYVKD